MKAILAGIALAGVLAASPGGCAPKESKPPTPIQPAPEKSALRVKVGDGIWVAGEDIAIGTWRFEEDWTKKPKCAWFVSPTNGVAGYNELPSDRSKEKLKVILLTSGQSVTLKGCGNLKLVQG